MYSPDALYKLTDLPLQEEDFENDEPTIDQDKDTKSETDPARPASAKS